MMLLSLLSHRHGKPETIVDLCFLHPMRLPVTAGRWSLSLLDKLNILSNFGSFSMVLLHWFLLFFMLSVTTWSNLFISLRLVECLSSYQSLSLDREEWESNQFMDESLLEYIYSSGNTWPWHFWYYSVHGASRTSWQFCISFYSASWELSAISSIYVQTLVLIDSISRIN